MIQSPLWELESCSDQGINGQTACPLLEGERTYSRHNEIDAIDPNQTLGAGRLLGHPPEQLHCIAPFGVVAPYTEERAQRRPSAILANDVVGHSRLIRRRSQHSPRTASRGQYLGIRQQWVDAEQTSLRPALCQCLML